MRAVKAHSASTRILWCTALKTLHHIMKHNKRHVAFNASCSAADQCLLPQLLDVVLQDIFLLYMTLTLHLLPQTFQATTPQQ